MGIALHLTPEDSYHPVQCTAVQTRREPDVPIHVSSRVLPSPERLPSVRMVRPYRGHLRSRIHIVCDVIPHRRVFFLYVIVNLWYPLQTFLRVRRRVLRTTLAFQFLYLATAPRWHLWTVVCVTAWGLRLSRIFLAWFYLYYGKHSYAVKARLLARLSMRKT